MNENTKNLISALLVMFHHKTFAAVVTTAAASTSVGFLAAAAGLNPAIWAFSTVGAAYVYLHHEDTPRNRIFNIVISILLGAFGSSASASWIQETYKVHNALMEVFLALVISMSWPLILEKLLGKKTKNNSNGD